MIGAFLSAYIAFAATLTEPVSGRSFAEVIDADGAALHLTGADIRKVSGITVYAIAHYGDARAPVPAGPDASLEYWIAASAAKAFILRGTRRVPARGIKWSWENSFDRVDYTGENRADFIAAFTEGFDKHSEMLILAQPDGTLVVKQDGNELDQWQDPALVRAVWEISLGESSEVKRRQNLVRRDHLEAAQ